MGRSTSARAETPRGETGARAAGAVAPVRRPALPHIDDPDGAVAFWPERRMLVLRRAVARDLPLTLKVPLDCYRGVAVDVRVAAAGTLASVAVVLAHADPDLEVVLYDAVDDHDLLAVWRGWGAKLGLPLLMRTETGDVDAYPRIGALALGTPGPRRARRAFLRRRLKASRRTFTPPQPAVHRGEREIIART